MKIKFIEFLLSSYLRNRVNNLCRWSRNICHPDTQHKHRDPPSPTSPLRRLCTRCTDCWWHRKDRWNTWRGQYNLCNSNSSKRLGIYRSHIWYNWEQNFDSIDPEYNRHTLIVGRKRPSLLGRRCRKIDRCWRQLDQWHRPRNHFGRHCRVFLKKKKQKGTKEKSQQRSSYFLNRVHMHIQYSVG